MANPSHLPDEVARLFWDVDPEGISVETHRDYVLERVMTRGGWAAMCWLRAQVPPQVLRDFVERRADTLPPRERAYWALVTGAEVELPPGGGRPSWAGP